MRSGLIMALILAIVALVVCVAVAKTQVGIDSSSSPKALGRSGGTTVGYSSSDSKTNEVGSKTSRRIEAPAQEGNRAETAQDNSAGSSEPQGKGTLGAVFFDDNAKWWGGQTDTGDYIVYLENQDTGQAGIFVDTADGVLMWGDGSLVIKGSETTIDFGNDDPVTLTIAKRDGDGLTIEASEWGSGVLPALSAEKRDSIRDSLVRIDNA